MAIPHSSYSVFMLISVIYAKSMSKTTEIAIHGVTDHLSLENEQYGKALQTCSEVFADVENLFNDEGFASRSGWFRDESNNEGDVVYAKDTPKGRMVTISKAIAGLPLNENIRALLEKDGNWNELCFLWISSHGVSNGTGYAVNCSHVFFSIRFDTTCSPLETEFPMSPADVMKETWNGMPTLPQWNQNINFAKVLASPTPNFDIVTYGNNDVLVVSGREFVSARIWRQVGDQYILASRSVEIKNFKSDHKNKVRAFLHLAGARFRPHPEKPDVTITDVIMLADLKGMLPKFLVNQVIGKVMIMDTVTNRKHFNELKKKRDSSV